MLTSRQIADARRALEIDRRARVREAMTSFDKEYDARMQELQDACGRIGHLWQPMDFGTIEDPVLCRVCGVAK